MISHNWIDNLSEAATNPRLASENITLAQEAEEELYYWLNVDVVLELVNAYKWYQLLTEMMNKAIIAEIADEISATEPEVSTPEQALVFRTTCRMVAAASAMRALEAAASICEGVNSHDNPMTAQDCADYIRDLIGVRDDY